MGAKVFDVRHGEWWIHIIVRSSSNMASCPNNWLVFGYNGLSVH